MKDASERAAPHLLPVYSFMLEIFSLSYTFGALRRAGRGFPGSVKVTFPEGLHLQTPVYRERGGKTLREHSSGITGPWTTLCPGGWQHPGSVPAKARLPPSPWGNTRQETLRSSSVLLDILRSLLGFT